jgi:SUN domain-containing protein 1/2
MPHVFFFLLQNIKGAKSAPPEAILEKKALPGACWPMEGSRGHVTIRLPYPIKVETFSLDHVSDDIVPYDKHESAPKKIRVFGYPPCPEEEKRCRALGFDDDDPMEIAQINYDADGPSVQTFNSVFVPTNDDDDGDDDDDNEDDDKDDDDDDIPSLTEDSDDDEGSCSAEAASCTSPPKIDFAAITVKIVENHGNPDYTCLYRFRVHGEQVYK